VSAPGCAAQSQRSALRRSRDYERKYSYFGEGSLNGRFDKREQNSPISIDREATGASFEPVAEKPSSHQLLRECNCTLWRKSCVALQSQSLSPRRRSIPARTMLYGPRPRPRPHNRSRLLRPDFRPPSLQLSPIACCHAVRRRRTVEQAVSFKYHPESVPPLAPSAQHFRPQF
jgi:hypothetical protein